MTISILRMRVIIRITMRIISIMARGMMIQEEKKVSATDPLFPDLQLSG